MKLLGAGSLDAIQDAADALNALDDHAWGILEGAMKALAEHEAPKRAFFELASLSKAERTAVFRALAAGAALESRGPSKRLAQLEEWFGGLPASSAS